LIIRTVEHLGKPLVATSANRSGDEPDTRTENLWLTNLSKDGTVLWLRPRRYIRRPVSTVVDCTGRRIRILRAGAISNAAIMSALGGSLHSGKA
jgi:tRNA A37 threonylcarbamoyladenosine synthetase subunit TsaC/SUA5/YrdC